MKSIKKLKWGFLLLAISVLSACKTIPPVQSWTMNPGHSPGTEWVLNLYEGNRAELILPLENRAVLEGEMFEERTGEYVFYMDRLSWFSRWHEGWSEAVFSTSGSMIISGATGQIKLQEKPEILGIQSAEVRYHEDRYYGDQAVDILSRRWTRIERSAGFFREISAGRDYTLIEEGFYNPESILDDYRNIFFPEIYDDDSEFPPVQPDLKDSSRYQRGEGMRWDTLYSAEYFPEDLQPVRNAGTLYRDFEEGRELLFLAWLWNDLWS